MQLKRWRWKLFLPACAIYWTAVVLFTFGAPIIAGWRVTRPNAGRGQMSASLSNSLLQIKMSAANTVGWSGTIDMGTFLLWLAVPPLLLWIFWLTTRQRDDVHVAADVRVLDEPMPDSFTGNATERTTKIPDSPSR